MGEVKKRKSTIRITGYNDLFGFMDPTKEPEALYDIPIDRLHEFKEHPFRVVNDEKMAELIESVKENGVLVPGIARKRDDGDFELISGHRRRYAAQIVGLEDMPIFVRDYTDEEATIVMVDANLQREEILPSEKARAYKMKYDALKKMKKRGSGRVIDGLSKEINDSRRSIERFISLCRLSDPLLARVDSGEIRLTQGELLSKLRVGEQEMLEDIISRMGWHISIAQAKQLREASAEKRLSEDRMVEILDPDGFKVQKVVLSQEFIKKYFPPHYRPDQIIEIVAGLLEKYGVPIDD